MKHTTTAVLRLFSVMTLSLALILQAGPVQTASAAQITNRSLTLQSGSGGDGGSLAGGTVNHLFTMDIESAASVGSIEFKYCTTAAAVAAGIDCDAPVGLDATGATLGVESGETGFSGIATTANSVIISRGAASGVTAGTVTYRLDGVVNPTTVNETFFVRVTMHSSLNATDPSPVHGGTVTASTAEPIVIDGTMPESLVFCTGETIGLTAGVPDCSTATPGVVSFNQLFSPTDTATATSQMAASTNAGFGYAITVNGTTLTSGSNTINPMATPTASNFGISQFGMNLMANTTPTVGLDVAAPSNATNFFGDPTADYGTADLFKYADGDAVAASAVGTDSQIYTSSYIVNVPGSQPAGTYTSTLTYICTPTF